ncbi:PAS domain S-box [Desulfocapsa sulfexigens DSM 10523]|uniref:histidine kinase n=1 Tax=Desulfocapsa sulfexigens (strain DSM 10523 / SB164P1) TaxID=1167006 RepID=M1NE31_DESSD|nr:PAS domain S-box protein [Desulfocapsa sulfexigens]AGF77954.1 PAS domain S-box [Desulfocapsa sulfexigens DSM 10523]
MIIELIKPLSLLLSLALLLAFVFYFFQRQSVTAKILSGILYGTMAVLAMNMPFKFTPGVIFDSRSVIVSLGGFFGGPIAAIVTAVIAAPYRYFLGGSGALAGALVVVLCAASGICWHSLQHRYNFKTRVWHLFVFGLLSHFVAMFGMLALPSDLIWDVTKNLAMPFFFIYPAVTVVLGIIIQSIYLFFERDEELVKTQKKLEKQSDVLQERVDELIRAEKQIGEDKVKLRRFESIVANSSDFMALVDKNFIYLAVNDTYARSSGKSKDELVGVRVEDVFGTKIFQTVIKPHAEKCLSGEAVYYEGWFEFENFGRRYIGVAYNPYMGEEGEIEGFTVVSRDITQRKEVEDALLASEKRFQDLVENSTDWIWEFDENEIFTYTSPRIKDLLGYTPEEILGQSAFYPMSSQESERVFNEFITFKKARKPFFSLININQHKNGEKVILESSGVPFFDNTGAFRGYRGIDRDITERTNLEEQIRQSHKMEAIGTLAGGIAHDFNNILSAILGYAEMAMYDLPDSSPAKDQIAEVLKAGNRAKDLVKHILSFSRKESMERSPVEIHLIVKEVIKLLRSTIPTTIEIKHHIDPHCGNILAEPNQIHQVLLNLCTNASQSMAEKGGVLEVGLISSQLSVNDLPAESHLKPGYYVQLSVKDNGIGIEQKYLEKIFDPYFTTKEVGKGSGMGLAVVMGIVKSHDGMITVDSKLGEGTIFNVYFPKIEEQVQGEIEDDVPIPTGSETILVVDDEESIADLTKQRAEYLGYRVFAKKSSVEALELFRSQPDAFDIVITDQTMPVLTGEHLAQRIKEIRMDIPIVLCTGYSPEIDTEQAKLAGISAFLMKPVDMREFAQTIRQVLDKDISST